MDQQVWTAAELELMSPAERDAIFDSSVATDLDAVPAAFVDRVRRRTLQRVEDAESHRP